MNYFSMVSKEEKIQMLSIMLNARNFEEKVNELFMLGLIHGTTHLGIGQEANHAGVSAALEKEDWIITTHRGHGHYLGKGGDAFGMMAELFGSKEGVSLGLGGSMHMTDLENYNLGSSGVVAGSVPLSVGMAFALKYKKINNLVLSLFGDGASNQGMLLESLNLASVWEVPVLFYCENNLYGMSGPAKKFLAGSSVTKRAESFGIKAISIDGNDIEQVYNAVKDASIYIKETKKPYLIESKTYRWLGHSKSDLRKYRTKEEEAEWRDNCPIKRYCEYLISNNILSENEVDNIKSDSLAYIDEITEKAKNTKDNIVDLNEALSYVYCSEEAEEWK